MGRNKLLNNYSDDELLELNEVAEESEITSSNSILQFFKHFDIKPGNFPVKKKLLYKLYTLWYNQEPESVYSFSVTLGLYFDTQYASVLIDKDQFKLTDSAFNKLNVKRFKKQELKINKNSELTLLLFLKEKNILRGKGFISRIGLYYIYEKWARDNRKRPISSRYFAMIISKRFNLSRTRKFGWGIRYDEKKSVITQEERISAMMWGKKYRKVHGNRKNKKVKEI